MIKMSNKYSLLRASLIYVAFSGFWIIASDTFVARVLPHNPAIEYYINLIKGLLFVIVSGGFFYYRLYQELMSRMKLASQHEEKQSQLLGRLEEQNALLHKSYETMISGWAKAVEIREKETAGHSQRVVKIMDFLTNQLDISWDERQEARWGALLHDIGKVGIPDQILLKPGRLTVEERAIIETHPVLAYQWVSEAKYLNNAGAILLHHHERWNGSGYPDHLREKDIPFLARLFAVIDVADAMGSDRPYRKAICIQDIYKHLQEEAGRLYDPEIVDLFLRLDIMHKKDLTQGYYQDRC